MHRGFVPRRYQVKGCFADGTALAATVLAICADEAERIAACQAGNRLAEGLVWCSTRPVNDLAFAWHDTALPPADDGAEPVPATPAEPPEVMPLRPRDKVLMAASVVMAIGSAVILCSSRAGA